MAARLPLSALLILAILVAASAPKAECIGGSNATRVADFLLDDEEFSVESGANRRILQVEFSDAKLRGTRQYGKPVKPFCNAQVYGSCIGPHSKFYTRPCDYQNRCKKV